MRRTRRWATANHLTEKAPLQAGRDNLRRRLSAPLFDEGLDLLLAAADDGRPALGEPLPSDAAEHARRPVGGANDTFTRFAPEADPNDLAAQGWAIVAPEGPEGDRLIEAIAPLRRLREEELGDPAKVFRVPAGLREDEARRWKLEVLAPEDARDEDAPLYLLLLGDLHQLSADLQHVLAVGSFAGRVCFTDESGAPSLEGYAAYADKVVRWSRGATTAEGPELLFYTAPDGSGATLAGDARLVRPGLAASQEALAAGRLPASSVRALEARSGDALLRVLGGEGAPPRPGVLLSVSHGLGAPRGGWRSPEEQRRRTGAMLIDPADVLDAERVTGRPFLPGGVWFYLACFGAGVPRESMYHAWLRELASEGALDASLREVQRNLPAAGDRPFVARLPQAVLASPTGPQGVVAHLDLAWTYGFSGTTRRMTSGRSRIVGALEALIRGGRVGVALGRLMKAYAETNDLLMANYQRERDARLAGRPSPVGAAEQAHLWMLRNDLRGYVLLGDPACRLPRSGHRSAEAGR